MLKVLYGNEPYCIDKAIEERKQGISMPEMNVSFFDGFSPEALMVCRTYPAIDGYRLVIIGVKELTEEIFQYREAPEFTELVVLPEAVDKRKGIFKELVKGGLTEEHSKLTEKQLQTFVMRRLKEEGGKITEGAYGILIERTGYLEDETVSLYTMETYLRQLLLLGSVVTKDAVRRIIPPTCSESVYALSKALMGNDPVHALRLGRMLLERGEQPIALLSLLLRPFRIGLKASLFPMEDMPAACALIGIPAYQMQNFIGYPKDVLGRAIDIIQGGISDIKNGGGSSVFLLTISRLVLALHAAERGQVCTMCRE